MESQLPADTAITTPGQLHDLRQLLIKLSARLLEGQARHERLTKHGQWKGRTPEGHAADGDSRGEALEGRAHLTADSQ